MESVGCAGVYLAVPGMLSLFATGRTSGLVLDAGHQQTTIVPVFQVGPIPLFSKGRRQNSLSVTTNRPQSMTNVGE